MSESVKFNLDIDTKSKIILSNNNVNHFNFLSQIASRKKVKKAKISVSQEKIVVSGEEKRNLESIRISLNKKDYRGGLVNFININLLMLIIGSIFFILGIFGIMVYNFDLFENNGDSMPLEIGIIFLILSIVIIYLGLKKKIII